MLNSTSGLTGPEPVDANQARLLTVALRNKPRRYPVSPHATARKPARDERRYSRREIHRERVPLDAVLQRLAEIRQQVLAIGRRVASTEQ